MADIQTKYGTSNQAITITVASLADGSMRESTAIDNSSNLHMDAYVGGKITTGTSPTADTTIAFYAYGSVDGGTFYSGGATGSDAAFSGEEEQLFFLGSVTVDGTSDKTYEIGPWSVVSGAVGGRRHFTCWRAGRQIFNWIQPS